MAMAMAMAMAMEMVVVMAMVMVMVMMMIMTMRMRIVMVMTWYRHSDESTRLPPYVGCVCCFSSRLREVYSPSTPVSPSPQKPTFPNSNSGILGVTNSLVSNKSPLLSEFMAQIKSSPQLSSMFDFIQRDAGSAESMNTSWIFRGCLTSAISLPHIYVVPRSTMNTNGEKQRINSEV